MTEKLVIGKIIDLMKEPETDVNTKRGVGLLMGEISRLEAENAALKDALADFLLYPDGSETVFMLWFINRVHRARALLEEKP